MYKILVGVVVLTFIFIVLIFFITKVFANVSKNAREIQTELERIQAPIYTPMGIATAIIKFFFSIFA